jgi:hypothetical protein
MPTESPRRTSQRRVELCGVINETETVDRMGVVLCCVRRIDVNACRLRGTLRSARVG